jgi:hypothetical protein
MTKQKKKPVVAGRKNNHRFGQRLNQPKFTNKTEVAGLKEVTFDVGASSNPTKVHAEDIQDA